MARRGLKLVGLGCLLTLFFSFPQPVAGVTKRDKVLFLIDQGVYEQIREEVQAYKQAVEVRLPVTVLLDHGRSYRQMSPEEVRGLLQEYYEEQSIVGVILGGRLPYALWENHDENRGILNSFYEDLNGTFEDRGHYEGSNFLSGNPNGIYDYHDWGSPSAEIFAAWLYPPPKNEVESLKFFLNKAHRYHLGDLTYRHRGLVMLHSDWAGDMDTRESYYRQLTQIFGKEVDRRGGLDALGSPIPIDGSDYLQLLKQTYGATILYAHGSPSGHFPDTTPVSVTDIAMNPGGSVVTFIGGCHTGDFELAATQGLEELIATVYLFNNPLGLATTATAWSYGPEELWQVTDKLSEGVWLGKAWLEKQRLRNGHLWYLIRSGCGFEPQRHDWGELLFGDPFVTFPCQPSCEGKNCGHDGCGGSCGSCPEDTYCQISGLCSQNTPWERVVLSSNKDILQNLFLKNYPRVSLRLPSGWWVSYPPATPSTLCTINSGLTELYYRFPAQP